MRRRHRTRPRSQARAQLQDYHVAELKHEAHHLRHDLEDTAGSRNEAHNALTALLPWAEKAAHQARIGYPLPRPDSRMLQQRVNEAGRAQCNSARLTKTTVHPFSDHADNSVLLSRHGYSASAFEGLRRRVMDGTISHNSAAILSALLKVDITSHGIIF